MKKNILFMAAAGLALGAVQSFAVATDITIVDFSPVNSSKWFAPGQGPDLEDNETEAPPQADPGQQWDQEAMALTPKAGPSHAILHMIGGYDYNFGTQLPTGAPGDLFIKVDGTNPGFLPNASGAGTVPNSPTYGTPGYTYAVDLSDGFGADLDLITPGIQAMVDVWQLKDTTVLETVQHDELNSNPWRVKEGAGLPDAIYLGKTKISYQTGLTAAQVATYTGVAAYGALQGSALNNNNIMNNLHNILDIDMNFVVLPTPGSTVKLSYTMQCGNDSLKGSVTGGFRVPDGGMTLSMLGLGIGALAVVARRKQ